MIPLNKPLINRSLSKANIDDFVKKYFSSNHYRITFSARQGLWEVYHQIKKQKGIQTVAVSPLTCVEAVYPIIENGHNIHFVDINTVTLNMDETIIPDGMDVVQAIHFGGNPQNMDVINSKSPSIIIEDCAQGFGSTFKELHVGNFGDFASFSFMKNFYSLGGGLLLSKNDSGLHKNDYIKFGFLHTGYRYLKRFFENDCSANKNLAHRFLSLLLYLKPEQTTAIINKSSNNDFILRSIEKQLGIEDLILQQRLSNAQKILSGISNSNLIHQKVTRLGETNHLRLFFILKQNSAKEIIGKLRRSGIGANHLTQNYLTPYQIRFDNNAELKKYVIKSNLQNYFELHDQIVSIPISPNLTTYELSYMCDTINQL